MIYKLRWKVNDILHRKCYYQMDQTKSKTANSRSSMASTATLAMATRVKRKMKQQKKEEPSETAVAMLESVETLKGERDAEIFQLTESLNRESSEVAELRREVVEKNYIIRRLEKTVSTQLIEVQQEKQKLISTEAYLQNQLTDVAQQHQRQVEQCGDLELELEKYKLKHTTSQLEIKSMREDKSELERTVRITENSALQMEDSLRMAVSKSQRENYDLRMHHSRQEKALNNRLDTLQSELLDFIQHTDNTLCDTSIKCRVLNEYTTFIEHITLKYRNLLSKCRLLTSRFSEDLLKVASLHSNLPEYLRDLLMNKSTESLVNLVDTLSFEVNVGQYLVALFPPDHQFGEFQKTGYPYTPSAAVLGPGFLSTHSRGTRPASAPVRGSSLLLLSEEAAPVRTTRDLSTVSRRKYLTRTSWNQSNE